MSRSYVERETTPSTSPDVTSAVTKSSCFAVLQGGIVGKVARLGGDVKLALVATSRK